MAREERQKRDTFTGAGKEQGAPAPFLDRRDATGLAATSRRGSAGQDEQAVAPVMFPSLALWPSSPGLIPSFQFSVTVLPVPQVTTAL